MTETSSLFISHSFSCGQSGGSYGGRGGLGLGKSKNENETLNCIKNSLSRLSSYGVTQFPLASGSRGSPLNFKYDETIAPPGAIVLITGEIFLSNDSKIISGYDNKTEYYGRGNSGGSLSIVYHRAEIFGELIANGMDSIGYKEGPGGGGRIHLYDVCWEEIGFKRNEGIEKIELKRVEANGGERPEIEIEELRKYKRITEAGNGSNYFICDF